MRIEGVSVMMHQNRVVPRYRYDRPCQSHYGFGGDFLFVLDLIIVASFEDFEKLDIRVGQILSSVALDDGKYSTHVLMIDFGDDLGIKKSCARLTKYDHDELVERRVVAVVNFEPRQIGKHMSEALVLGVVDEEGECDLLSVDRTPPLGGKIS